MKNILTIAIMALTVNAFAQIPTNGLIAHYPFNGNANDQSGNNYNGTVYGATLTTDRFGNVNSAYSFNGSSDYIQVADASALRLSGTDYTISVWFNETYLVNTEHQAIISKRNPYTPPANMDGWLLYIDVLTTPMGKVGIVPAGYPNTCAYTADPITLNNWVNIVEVYHSGTQVVETYMNGVLNNTTNGVSSPNNTTTLPLYIGSDKESNSYFFNGKIDDICIYNRALTTAGVDSLFNANICYQTITVTDTLIINANLTGFNPVTYQNSIKIFPNPTNDHITIDFGNNYSTLNGYTLTIENTLSQIVYTTPINTQQTTVDLSTWTGNGIYFVHLIDVQSNTIDIRKIVLQ